jgi:hypothetical protein
LSWSQTLIYGIKRAARKEGTKKSPDIRCEQLAPGGLGKRQ